MQMLKTVVLCSVVVCLWAGDALAQAGGAIAGSIAHSQDDQIDAVANPLFTPRKTKQMIPVLEIPKVESKAGAAQAGVVKAGGDGRGYGMAQPRKGGG